MWFRITCVREREREREGGREGGGERERGEREGEPGPIKHWSPVFLENKIGKEKREQPGNRRCVGSGSLFFFPKKIKIQKENLDQHGIRGFAEVYRIH